MTETTILMYIHFKDCAIAKYIPYVCNENKI